MVNKKASFFALVASLLLGVARASTSALATRREYEDDRTVSIYLISFIHVPCHYVHTRANVRVSVRASAQY